MHPDAPESESCKLQTRHWIITDEEGGEERVDGPGVIGTLVINLYICACLSNVKVLIEPEYQ